MISCGNCNHPHDELYVGDRVELSSWEKSMLNKDMRGIVEQLGHPETMRRNTAKIRWDNKHKDQWWPISMLFKAQP